MCFPQVVLRYRWVRCLRLGRAELRVVRVGIKTFGKVSTIAGGPVVAHVSFVMCAVIPRPVQSE